MTALAAVVVLAGFVLAGRVAVRVRRADRLVRRLLQEAAQQSLEHAARRGVVNLAPPRRWSSDRQRPSNPEPAPRVIDLMPHH